LAGESLLFPFLLLEAKSGKSADDWHSIWLQSAFPIRTFLQTQQRLYKMAGCPPKWESGPLVWFVSNKGQDWSVSLAYIAEEKVRNDTTTQDFHVSLEFNRLPCGSVLTILSEL
jgi:hypothetical protein